MMRKLIVAGFALLLALPATAQQQKPGQPPPEPSGPSTLNKEDVQGGERTELMLQMMDYTLPYKDGQTIHYQDETTGEEVGFAHRMGLKITFFDKNDHFIGEAIRRTQAVTAYFDADGNFLGTRVYQQQTALRRHINVKPRPGEAARARPSGDAPQ
jgi:hypothetical protein